MPSKSKTKGNKFEYEIVKILNKAYDTEQFSRTPNSGAMMGRTNWGKNQGLAESVKRTLGSDIIVPDDFAFSIECKHYKNDPNYAQMIKGPESNVHHWLAECLYDAINLDLNALLFFKTNNKGTHFALPYYFYESYLKGTQFLLYGPFVISGIDTFLENAERIKFLGQALEVQRHEWTSREDVQKFLEVL